VGSVLLVDRWRNAEGSALAIVAASAAPPANPANDGCPRALTSLPHLVGFVANRRTPSTRTFLSQLIVPTNFNIQRFLRARNPPRTDTQDLLP